MTRIVRRVAARLGYGRAMATPRPVALSAVLAEVPGCWVAVDRTTNELRAAARSPYELAAEIRKRGLTGIAIVRAPQRSEPQLVGLG